MEAINELALRELLLRKMKPSEMAEKVLKHIADASISWDEKRALFHFLYNIGQDAVLARAIKEAFDRKERAPFDLLIDLSARANIQPESSVLESVFKGLKKQKAFEEIVSAKGWDKWDSRFAIARNEFIEEKLNAVKHFKENMIEKFQFLRNQRMTEQAGRVLKRVLELYPDDPELMNMKRDFEVDWARNVLSNHMAALQTEALERTHTEPSSTDEEMLQTFLSEGEKAAYENRQIAFELAIAFWFMEDYSNAIEILNFAPPGISSDWMRAELMFADRRYLEALEQLNQLEVKYIDDPETTFAVSYLRAQCLHGLGQQASAIEILQSIVRVRPHYRSAHAFILDWASGVSWE